MHLRDVLGGLLISKELKVEFIDIISMLNGNMKHTDSSYCIWIGEYSSHVIKNNLTEY